MLIERFWQTADVQSAVLCDRLKKGRWKIVMGSVGARGGVFPTVEDQAFSAFCLVGVAFLDARFDFKRAAEKGYGV